MGYNKVVFRLCRFWKDGDKLIELYPAIKNREKTSEWRDMTSYWSRILVSPHYRITPPKEGAVLDLTIALRVRKAWFTVGFPKDNVPRLEADIKGLFAHFDTRQYEIKIENVREVTENPQRRLD